MKTPRQCKGTATYNFPDYDAITNRCTTERDRESEREREREREDGGEGNVHSESYPRMKRYREALIADSVTKSLIRSFFLITSRCASRRTALVVNST